MVNPARRVSELLEDNLEAVDRHYKLIFTLTLLALVSGAITATAILRCNAGEFLGLVAVALFLWFVLDLAYRRYYNRMNGR